MNQEDSWLIVGPGRTGSKVIVDVIRSALRYHGLNFTYIAPGQTPEAKPGNILHSHIASDLRLGYTHSILSTRNCVESALSWCIQPHVGEWHLYQHRHKEKLTQINSFVLDPAKVITEYRSIRYFYDNLQEYLTPATVIIDYSEFRDDPLVILSRLGLDTSIPLNFMPAKNPGNYSDWIKNWDEVFEAVKDLPTNPLLIPVDA